MILQVKQGTLTQQEAAKMLGWSQSKVSRRVNETNIYISLNPIEKHDLLTAITRKQQGDPMTFLQIESIVNQYARDRHGANKKVSREELKRIFEEKKLVKRTAKVQDPARSTVKFEQMITTLKDIDNIRKRYSIKPVSLILLFLSEVIFRKTF